MKLYHGTSTKHLDKMLTEGIKPTGVTGVKSLWEVESAKDRVYLTSTYALYFAIHAAMKDECDAVVIEVDVDENQLIPDEDFLAQVKYKDSEHDLITLTELIRDDIPNYSKFDTIQLAEASLNNLGTVSISEVKPEQIIRHVIVPNHHLADIVMSHCDPTISVMHHKLMSTVYKENMLALFAQYPTEIVDDTSGIL